MKTGNCPSCGAPIEFAPGAGQVKVCEHCQTVVLRGEAKLEKVGKVAELVDTDSPLKLGLSGKHSGNGFTIAGRIQKAHQTEDNAEYGAWDEWYLSFDDGRSGWLSESEGAWNLMFPLSEQKPPPWADAAPGVPFNLKGTRFVVEERAEARTVSAEGQLPEFHPRHPFVDATGPKGVFVSIDYGGGEPGEAFVGSTVTLESLGFDKGELSPTARRQAMSGARCTQCNGMLELKAPDLARRVACPYCGALLDCSHGKLAFLELLKKPQLEPEIPLGAKGTLEGADWVCIAFLVRSCEVELIKYSWEEYLLYNRAQGFRWLMEANGHWTFLTPIPAGEVDVAFKAAKWGGETYQQYQSVNTVTDYVLGECYWAVSQGERGWAAEYIAPPKSINLDRTPNEVTFTAGKLLSNAEVQQAFHLKAGLRSPSGVAPAQVNPWKDSASASWKWSFLWSGGLLALFIVFSVMSAHGSLMRQTFSLAPGVAPASPESMRFSEPFKISAKTPIEVTVGTSGLDNQWVGVQTDFVNQDTFEVVSLYFELSDYHGVDDGESWSEGSSNLTKSTAEMDPGTWLVRVTPSFEPAKPPKGDLQVSAEADSPGLCCPLVMVLFIFCIPIFYASRKASFETSRWNDSVMQPPNYSGAMSTRSASSSSDDDDDDDGGDDE